MESGDKPNDHLQQIHVEPRHSKLNRLPSNLKSSTHSLSGSKSGSASPVVKRHIRLAVEPKTHSRLGHATTDADESDDSDDSDENIPNDIPDIPDVIPPYLSVPDGNREIMISVEHAQDGNLNPELKSSVSFINLKPPAESNPQRNSVSRNSARESANSDNENDKSPGGRKSYASSGSSGNAFGSHPLTRLYNRARYFFTDKYYKYITFRKECLLLLLSLFPYGVIIGVLDYMDRTIIYDYYLSVGLKVALILIGMFAEQAVSIVNQRHSDLTAMINVLGNESTPETILDGTKGNQTNWLLKYLALIFNAVLIASELSIEPMPVLTPYGMGSTVSLNYQPASVVVPNTTAIFNLALGTGFSCQACAGLHSEHSLIVPISSFLNTLLTTDESLETIFSYQAQDVIGIEVRCFTMINPPTLSTTEFVRFHIEEIVWGQNSSIAEFQVFSRTAEQATKGMQCRGIFADRRANVAFEYSVQRGKHLKKEKVLSMEPEDPSTCFEYESICVNFPSRSDLSYSLLKNALNRNEYLVDKNTEFPDPIRFTSEHDFEHDIQEFLSVLLLNSAGSFTDEQDTKPVYTNNKAARFRIEQWLRMTILGLSCGCIGISVLLIVFDLIQLGRAPNELLRRIHSAVSPGKDHLESLAVYAASNMNTNTMVDDWTKHLVRFGEDRRTVGESQGILRFGAKKEIVRYKINRDYF